MSQANLGWLFYREYFRGYRYPTDKKGRENASSFFEEKNNKLYNYRWEQYGNLTAYPKLTNLPGFDSLSLVTSYPGLLIGTGYNHDIAAVGATKIGFYFDHTTGLPVYPGSSVKGVLRDVFPGQDQKRINEGDKNAESLRSLVEGKTAYLKEVLKKLGIPEVKLDEESYLIDLEEELFNGHVRVIVKDRDVMLAIPPPQRFICHDAIVTATAGQLMGPDFITPHKSRKDHVPDEVVEPNPIQLLKVMPGVTFQFTFQASPTYRLENGETREATLAPQQVTSLCRRILLDRGIGAKTNVGYGQLNEVNKSLSARPMQRAAPRIGNANTKTVPPTEAAKRATANFFRGKYRFGDEMAMEAEVVESAVPSRKKPNRVKVFIAEGNIPIFDLTKYNAAIDIGTILKVGVRMKSDLMLTQVIFRDFKK